MEKKKRKTLKLTTLAFTLVELTAVLVILGVILMIIIPIVNNSINESKQKMYDEQIDRVINEAIKYSINNDLGYEDEMYKTLPFDDLLKDGLITEIPIDPFTNEELEGCLVYSWMNNLDNYDIKYDKDCDPTDDNAGFIVTIDLVPSKTSPNGWVNSDYTVDVVTNASDNKHCISNTTCTPNIENTDININTDGIYTVCAVGIKGSRESEIICEEFKLDKTTPTITPKPQEVNILENTDLNSEDLFDVTYGISGGTTTCAPANLNTLTQGTHTITCTATGNNEKTSQATKEVKVYSSTVDIALVPTKTASNGWVNSDYQINVNTNGTSYTYCIGTNCTPNLTGTININTNGIYNVCAIATNGLINSEKVCGEFKLDKTTPIITSKQENISLNRNTNSLIKDYFNTTFGPSGGDYTCNFTNTNELSDGDNNITCTATGNNGKTSTITKNFQIIVPNLMVDGAEFKSKIYNYKSTIKQINFYSIKTGKYDTATIKWDFSEENNEAVVGYIEEINGEQILNIEANGKIIAHEFIGGLGEKYAMFSEMNLKTINFNDNFDTSNVRNMSYLFSSSSILSLDLSSFDTSNVSTMKGMFNIALGFTNLDLSNFNTSNVTDMSNMFRNTVNVTKLDLSSFDTSKVKNMSYMFYYTRDLVNLNINSFDTSNVTNMGGMFYDLSNLTSLDVSDFDTGNVTNMYSMFYSVSSITSLNVSNFDTSNVTDMSRMFYNVSSITSLNVSNFDTSNVTDMSRMFYNVSSITSLNVSKFDTGNVTNMSYMFRGLNSLTHLDVSNFDTSNVTNMYHMFGYLSNLPSLDLSSFDTSNVTNMGGMFNGASRLTNLNISSFNTSNVTNMSYMFSGASSLTNLDLSHFNTSNVTNMSAMFQWLENLQTINLTNFLTNKVTNMSYMFNGVISLTELDLSSFDISNVTNMSHMFSTALRVDNAYARTQADATKFNLSFSYLNFKVK